MSKKKYRGPARYTGPGNTVVLPGGHKATFYTDEDIPVWKDREITVIASQVNMMKMKALSQARAVEIDGQPVDESDILRGQIVTMTEQESRIIYRLTDTCIWAYLKGWTLRRTDGTPLPLPQTPDDVARVVENKAMYEALSAAANSQWIATQQRDNFSVDAFEDQDSPTGVSGD